jgi:hypothetical protein
METFIEKEPLILREYGRNVQKLVQYITTLPTIEERTQASHILIHLMKQLNPSVREYNDNMQRIWDHLHHMANFNLDIDAPYPKPTPETLFAKPQKLAYATSQPKFRHYGKNIELLIGRALLLQEAEEKLYAVQQIMRLMRGFYAAANNDNVEDEILLDHIRILSNGKLHIGIADLADEPPHNRNLNRNQQRQQSNNNGSNGVNNNNNRHNHSNNNNRNRHSETRSRNREQPNPEKRSNNNPQNNRNFKKK